MLHGISNSYWKPLAICRMCVRAHGDSSNSIWWCVPLCVSMPVCVPKYLNWGEGVTRVGEKENRQEDLTPGYWALTTPRRPCPPLWPRCGLR